MVGTRVEKEQKERARWREDESANPCDVEGRGGDVAFGLLNLPPRLRWPPPIVRLQSSKTP